MTALNLPIAILRLVLGVAQIDGTSHPGGNPPIMHVFGGQPAKIDLGVETPGGSPVEIQADLYQKGQSLVVPIKKEIPVARAVHSDENQPFHSLISWTLLVPEVKRETEMIACLRIKTISGEWTPAGQILIKAYPQGFAMEPLVAFSKERGLHLFGENKRLRAFLNAQKMEFDNVGDGLAELPMKPEDKGIYIGEATSNDLEDWLAVHPAWQGNIVVFCPDSSLLPGVFVTTQSGFQTVKVTLPLLDNLSSDPRSQKTLLEILNTVAASTKPNL